jgi:hypothetical protein
LGLKDKRCALAIAHPGHELRVLGSLFELCPAVYILTDGSGSRGIPRISSTSRLIQEIGGTNSFMFGQYNDRQIYALVLAKASSFFLKISDQLAEDWIRNDIETVIGDAYEGAIMTHDLWRGIIDRAIRIASNALGREIENLEFELEKNPLSPSEQAEVHSVIRLPDEVWQRKIQIARAYEELKTEVDYAFEHWGTQVFQFETFLKNRGLSRRNWSSPPLYEKHGERRVAEGVYQQAVRFNEHVKPILEDLERDKIPA